jgi:hypothetical protein
MSRAAAGAVLLACSGCLVTSQYEIPDPTNVPPIIQDDPTSIPINSIVWLDSENPQSWSFSVLVRDEDTEQELDARWRLVKQGEPTPAFTPLDPLLPGELPRTLEIRLSSLQLSDGECHHLELAVSGHFWKDPRTGMHLTEPLFFSEVTPDFADDLALASWWIWEGEGNTQTTNDEKARLNDSCNALESLLGNASTVEAPQ